MKLRAIAAAICISLCTASAGAAATFTVNNVDYDLTSVTGTFDSLRSILMDQAWWGNRVLADSLVNEVELSLGENPNYGGVFFALGIVNNSIGEQFTFRFWHPHPQLGGDTAGTDNTDRVRTFAIATPISAVPLPAGGLLLLSAVGGIAALKRRKKRAA